MHLLWPQLNAVSWTERCRVIKILGLDLIYTVMNVPNFALCIMYSRSCAYYTWDYLGPLLYSWYVIMYNAHPFFPLKNLGRKVHIIHGKIHKWHLRANSLLWSNICKDLNQKTCIKHPDPLDWEPNSHRFTSQGYMPRLWARSPEGGTREATTHLFLLP